MKFIFLILISVCCTTIAAETADLPALENLVGQWVNLRKEIAQEKQSRDSQKKQWQLENSLLQKESKRLDRAIAEAEKFKTGNAGLIAENIKRKKQLEESLDNTAGVIDKLTADLAEIIPAIPDSLMSDNLKSFADKPRNAKGSVTKQLQLLVSALTEIEKIENESHFTRELLLIGDRRREMDVVYLGLACGFAVSADNSTAAAGHPSKSGWKWSEKPEIASEVRKLVSIKKHQLPPQLVTLPLSGKVRQVSQ